MFAGSRAGGLRWEGSFGRDLVCLQVDLHGRAFADFRADRHRVRETRQYLFAQIQAEPGGFSESAAVVAGEALFADPRDIFRCDPDACVADNESFRSFI